MTGCWQILDAIKDGYPLSTDGDHGITHWALVRENGIDARWSGICRETCWRYGGGPMMHAEVERAALDGHGEVASWRSGF
jgi:hypothetical protein